ncbi:MAG: hypothetical protein II980_00415, partial [Clostridia bacterium]|nr:hypothetical protein [Clostridia bacterium]
RFATKGKRKQVLDALRQKAKTKKAQYTEQEYNAFGWVRANNVINAGQYKDFTTKFAEAINGSKAFVKTKQGEFMIPVSDIYDKVFEGVNNTIVYAKGTIEQPIITRVLQILEFEETILDKMRRIVYASERRGIQQKNRNLYRYYNRTNYGYDWYIKGNGKKDT